MIFDIRKQISYLSQGTTLEAGTIFLTGEESQHCMKLWLTNPQARPPALASSANPKSS